ncbi:MAG: STAS domain-containing protein [Gammaproteobacteria bacterium]
MESRTRTEGGYTIIELEGEVDLSCSPEVRKVILDILKSGQHLLVDLSAVSYIDSSGVASLVEGYQVAKRKKLKFGLVGVSQSAMGVLVLARLDKIFPIHANVQERIRADD